MTPAAKFLRRMAEKWLGTWTEGPEPPERLANMVLVFAVEHPEATRGDWIRFAVEHGNECYRSAYVRGVEHVERDPEAARPGLPPEAIADEVDPSWRWGDEVDLTGQALDKVVPTEEPPEREMMAEHVERMRRRAAERRKG